MNRTKIIIDCDPGIDDSIMLCLAAAYERQLEILAVTTVAGNHLIDKVTKNALDVLDFLKMDVPVARGMDTHSESSKTGRGCSWGERIGKCDTS